MNDATILDRVKTRLGSTRPPDDLINEFIQTINDRLCIRLDEEKLPEVFNSICVDAVIKAVRRIYYEGISSENVSNLSTSFYEDILSEYANEINSFLKGKINSSGNGKVVHFL